MPSNPWEREPSSGLPRPGKVVMAALCLVFGLWLSFAVGMNWAGVSPEVFALFCGNAALITHGQVWRLASAPLVQDPSGFWPVFGVLVSLYFFATPLEQQWGRKRLIGFLCALCVVPGVIETLFGSFVPPSIAHSFSGAYWFGGLAVASGVTIAWAMNFRGGSVRLYGVLPVSPRMLIGIVVLSPLLSLVFRTPPSEGFLGLYSGMVTGFLLGGGTPSPLRRYWLNFRLNRLDAEVRRESQARKQRVGRSPLKVIEGGRKTDPRDGDGGRGPDGRWLN